MDYIDLKILQRLIDDRNITKTAQALFLTQPTITKRLQKIEEEFQTEIFIRHSKGITFTPKGLFLAQQAIKLLVEYDDLKNNIHSFSNCDVEGTLRLAVNMPFARGELPNIIAAFNQLYPKVTYDIYTDYSQKNYYKLYSGELPVGFVRGDYSWPHEKILVAKEKLYALYSKPFCLKNLPEIPEICSRFYFRLEAEKEAWWNTYFDRRPYHTITVEDSSIALQFVKAGLGFTVCPGVVFSGRENDFYKLPLQNKEGNYLTRSTWLYYRQKSLENPIVKLFVDFMSTRSHKDASVPDESAYSEKDRAYLG